MSVPTHGPGCQTRMWATACQDCRKHVFFFSCSCGSKVFFDQPGPPWPLHADHCLPYQVRLFRSDDGRSPEEIRRFIERAATRLGVPIPPEVDKLIPALRKHRELSVLDIRPTGDLAEVTGQIMSCDAVNFFRRFDLMDNPLGRAMLGDLLNQSYVEIAIREPQDDESMTANQFRVFVSPRVAPPSELRQGRVITVEIVPRTILQRHTIWVAKEVRTV